MIPFKIMEENKIKPENEFKEQPKIKIPVDVNKIMEENKTRPEPKIEFKEQPKIEIPVDVNKCVQCNIDNKKCCTHLNSGIFNPGDGITIIRIIVMIVSMIFSK